MKKHYRLTFHLKRFMIHNVPNMLVVRTKYLYNMNSELFFSQEQSIKERIDVASGKNQ